MEWVDGLVGKHESSKQANAISSMAFYLGCHQKVLPICGLCLPTSDKEDP